MLIVLSSYLTCSEESEDFYEFTAEDYYRVLATKKEGNVACRFSSDFRLVIPKRIFHDGTPKILISSNRVQISA